MVTQVEIARALGIDVSSVNKILNGKRGPSFRKTTVDQVFRTARKMGYRRKAGSKAEILAALREIFPVETADEVLAVRLGITPERAKEIKALIKAAE